MFIYVCMYFFMRVCINVRMYECINVCMNVCLYIYISMNARVYLFMYVYFTPVDKAQCVRYRNVNIVTSNKTDVY